MCTVLICVISHKGLGQFKIGKHANFKIPICSYADIMQLNKGLVRRNDI